MQHCFFKVFFPLNLSSQQFITHQLHIAREEEKRFQVHALLRCQSTLCHPPLAATSGRQWMQSSHPRIAWMTSWFALPSPFGSLSNTVTTALPCSSGVACQNRCWLQAGSHCWRVIPNCLQKAVSCRSMRTGLVPSLAAFNESYVKDASSFLTGSNLLPGHLWSRFHSVGRSLRQNEGILHFKVCGRHLCFDALVGGACKVVHHVHAISRCGNVASPGHHQRATRSSSCSASPLSVSATC